MCRHAKTQTNDVTAVPVNLFVWDQNGNYRSNGSTTTDASGLFTYTWTPDIEGSYIVAAQFPGSESYYPSSAESYFVVMGATPAPAATEPPTQMPAYEMYTLGMGIAIIIALAVATLLILRKH